jgi:formate dehydrogenase maturation protein FdhE
MMSKYLAKGIEMIFGYRRRCVVKQVGWEAMRSKCCHFNDSANISMDALNEHIW